MFLGFLLGKGWEYVCTSLALKDVVGWSVTIFVGTLVAYVIGKANHARTEISNQIKKKKGTLSKKWKEIDEALNNLKVRIGEHGNRFKDMPPIVSDSATLIQDIKKIESDWLSHLATFARNRNHPFDFYQRKGKKYKELTTSEDITEGLWVEAANELTQRIAHLIDVCKIQFTMEATRKSYNITLKNVPNEADYIKYLDVVYSNALRASNVFGGELDSHT